MRGLSAWLHPGPRCPICGGTVFVPFAGRPGAMCAGCDAKERHRLLALVLPHVPADPRNAALPVVHLAPEPGIARLLHARFPRTYTPADIDPARYPAHPVPLVRVDLSDPAACFRPASVAGFVHSHVLEHVPAALDHVLPAMNACLAPGGFHVFQLPIAPGPTDEDLSPTLTDADRLRRFGQRDHVRRVGAADLDRDVLRHFAGFARIDVARVVSARAARRAGIPDAARTGPSGHGVHAYVKPVRA
jgi:phosphoglycolate phosphatase